jgi:hypothetical protein
VLVLTLLVQAPDESSLRQLLDNATFRQLVEQSGGSLVLVDNGRVTPLPPVGGGEQHQ